MRQASAASEAGENAPKTRHCRDNFVGVHPTKTNFLHVMVFVSIVDQRFV
jgi:hypothetical protein